jgi:hypothetical protein
MHVGIRTVLTLAEIAAAIEAFESGQENAQDTLARIMAACNAAVEPAATKRDAA